MKLLPGEFRAVGRKNRKTGEPELLFFRGAGLTDQQFEFLRECVADEQWDIRHLTFAERLPAGLSLWEDLRARGYDLTTFKFSLCTNADKAYQPRRLRSPENIAGRLDVRWGRLPDENYGDVVCSWQVPCSKRDANLLLAFLASAKLTWKEFANNTPVFDSLLDRFTKLGLDKRTLRIVAHHPGARVDDAANAAITEVTLCG